MRTCVDACALAARVANGSASGSITAERRVSMGPLPEDARRLPEMLMPVAG
jgi:hypothetical protein